MIADASDAHTTIQLKVFFLFSKIHKTPLILTSLICVELTSVIDKKAHVDLPQCWIMPTLILSLQALGQMTSTWTSCAITASIRQRYIQCIYSDTNSFAVEAAGGIFQIRPHKDFTPSKGRERILSLPLLLDLPSTENPDTHDLSDAGQITEPRNAYDFMRMRRDVGSDPTLKRWNASIRWSNFASADSSPLCVSCSLLKIC
jgi:hypothetical protein